MDAALARGESVLIHCMAGAHRAGTVGVAVVMRLSAGPDRRFAPYDDTLAAARRRRPILEPDLVAQGIGTHLLRLLDGSAGPAAGQIPRLGSGVAIVQTPAPGPGAATAEPRVWLGGTFGAGNTSTDPMAALAERMLRHLKAGVPRHSIVMAAAQRCGRPPGDVELLLQAAERRGPPASPTVGHNSRPTVEQH